MELGISTSGVETLLSDQICFSRSNNSAPISVSLSIVMPSLRLLRGVLS